MANKKAKAKARKAAENLRKEETRAAESKPATSSSAPQTAAATAGDRIAVPVDLATQIKVVHTPGDSTGKRRIIVTTTANAPPGVVLSREQMEIFTLQQTSRWFAKREYEAKQPRHDSPTNDTPMPLPGKVEDQAAKSDAVDAGKSNGQADHRAGVENWKAVLAAMEATSRAESARGRSRNALMQGLVQFNRNTAWLNALEREWGRK